LSWTKLTQRGEFKFLFPGRAGCLPVTSHKEGKEKSPFRRGKSAEIPRGRGEKGGGVKMREGKELHERGLHENKHDTKRDPADPRFRTRN